MLRRVGGALAPSVTAVLAVGAVVVVLLAWFGRAASPPPRDAAAAPVTPTATPGAVAASPAAPSTPAPRRTHEPPRATQTPRPMPVAVLNNSRIKGLAATAAGTLRERGWHIAVVGNWRGRLRDTTVYFPYGAERQARRLAAALPGSERVLPRRRGMAGDVLTVVVTRHYVGR